MTRRSFFRKGTASITAFVGALGIQLKCRAGWKPNNPIRLTHINQIGEGMLFYVPSDDGARGMWQVVQRMPSPFEHCGVWYDNYKLWIFACKPMFKMQCPLWLPLNKRGEAMFCFNGLLETCEFYRV